MPAASHIDPKLLEYRVHGDWWPTLAKAGITLMVSREYEHLVMAMTMRHGEPHISYMTIPHPSGIAIDREQGIVYVASTRNPNQILELCPARCLLSRTDVRVEKLRDRPLVPIRARFVPGCLYIHDLALVGGKLHAAAAGMNAIVAFDREGDFSRVWWPRSLDTKAGAFRQNYLQLNSIAAGSSLMGSYFSASTETPLRLRPGHPDFPVDRKGVVFSGKTREVITFGLTRPHSARFHRGRVWVNNSGYGEIGEATRGRFQPIARFPGWTRGLCFFGDIAFVGVSRIIPRFRAYAPGLDVNKSHCGVFALNTKTGKVLGSIKWSCGNQIFALDWAPQEMTSGFAFTIQKARRISPRSDLFYAFSLTSKGVSK
jgi:uncharacterized protein (TIGR03032 family)